MKPLTIAAFAFFCAAASAQAPIPRPVPDRDKAPPRSLCDALAGAEPSSAAGNSSRRR